MGRLENWFFYSLFIRLVALVMTILDNYETADAAFRTGRVLTESNETLLAHLHGLSNQNNINTGTQHRDIIRGLTINNILLQRHVESLQGHITALDGKNSRLQWSVVALTIASLIAAVVQTTVAIRAELRAEPMTQSNATLQQQLPSPSIAPSQQATPISGQPTKNAP